MDPEYSEYSENRSGTDPASHASGSSSGTKTVLLMFGFGLVMVGALWLYWELYTRPFRPLQNAIAVAFPESRPSVIGGRHKSHQLGATNTLRIVLQMPMDDFDPQSDEVQREARALELALLAKQYGNLDRYQVLEIHLVQRPPEQPQRLWTKSATVEEWNSKLKANQ